LHAQRSRLIVSATTFPPTLSNLSTAELGAWRGLLRVHSALIRDLDGQLEREHDLPLSSYEVLLTLEASPQSRMRMSELADSVLLSRSGCTRLVDRLEREGLVTRGECSGDARGAYAVLTEAGRERFRAARMTHLEGVRARFTSRFSEEELARMATLWDRVLPGAAGIEPPCGDG
jgi:DNA-binding MarR family transcriptional regulator